MWCRCCSRVGPHGYGGRRGGRRLVMVHIFWCVWAVGSASWNGLLEVRRCLFISPCDPLRPNTIPVFWWQPNREKIGDDTNNDNNDGNDNNERTTGAQCRLASRINKKMSARSRGCLARGHQVAWPDPQCHRCNMVPENHLCVDSVPFYWLLFFIPFFFVCGSFSIFFLSPHHTCETRKKSRRYIEQKSWQRRRPRRQRQHATRHLYVPCLMPDLPTNKLRRCAPSCGPNGLGIMTCGASLWAPTTKGVILSSLTWDTTPNRSRRPCPSPHSAGSRSLYVPVSSVALLPIDRRPHLTPTPPLFFVTSFACFHDLAT